MIRALIVFVGVGMLLWAPWMDKLSSEDVANTLLSAYGPAPAVCYDSDGKVLFEGLRVGWYPMGRIVHTCHGDYVLWFWGAVKEAGGVYKRAEDIEPMKLSKALTCEEVLKRQESRRATSTDNEIVRFEGPAAQSVDVTLFPELAERRTLLLEALRRGPTFAGKFAVAEWECGSSCQEHAVIDVGTGRVVSHGPETEYGVEYSLESTVLATNPVKNLPALPESAYETESLALSIARLPREYYRLTKDVLSDTEYLVRQCIESSAAGYIEVEDERIGLSSGE